jgi:hypothetical protein
MLTIFDQATRSLLCALLQLPATVLLEERSALNANA